MKMLSQGVAKGNLSVTTRRVITENAPFANRSESDSDLLRTFEITSFVKIAPEVMNCKRKFQVAIKKRPGGSNDA